MWANKNIYFRYGLVVMIFLLFLLRQCSVEEYSILCASFLVKKYIYIYIYLLIIILFSMNDRFSKPIFHTPKSLLSFAQLLNVNSYDSLLLPRLIWFVIKLNIE